MIKIGGQIGAFNTVALIFLTALIGIFFARIQAYSNYKIGDNKFIQKRNSIV